MSYVNAVEKEVSQWPTSKKRSSELEENQGEMMGYDGSPAKVLPNARRRMMPPTPQQISHSSTDESQCKRSWKRKASGAFRKEGQ